MKKYSNTIIIVDGDCQLGIYVDSELTISGPIFDDTWSLTYLIRIGQMKPSYKIEIAQSLTVSEFPEDIRDIPDLEIEDE